MAEPVGVFDHLFPKAAAPTEGGVFDHLFPGKKAPVEEEGNVFLEAGKGLASGALQGVGGGLQGAATYKASIQRDKIQQQVTLEVLDELGLEVGKEFTPEQRKKFAARVNERMAEIPVEDFTKTGTFEAGTAVKGFAERNLRAAEDYEQSWTRWFTEALGSTAPAIATYLAGLAPGVVAGSMMSAGETVDRAIKAGAKPEQILDAVRLGIVPGATEPLPLDGLLEKIPVGKWGAVVTAIGRVGKRALAEGGQEAVSQGLQNLIAQYVYKPDQDIMEGVAKAFGTGAAVGGAIQTAATPFTYGEPAEEIGPPSTGVPAGAAPAEGIIPPEQQAAPTIPPAAQPAPTPTPVAVPAPTPAAPAEELRKAATIVPGMAETVAKAAERPDSPRLTPQDRMSPIPNELIDDGKAAVEAATGRESTFTTTMEVDGKRTVVTGNVRDLVEQNKAETAALIDQITAGVSQPGIAAPAPLAAPPASEPEVAAVGLPAPAIASPAPALAETAPKSKLPLSEQIARLKARNAAFDAEVERLASGGKSVRMVSNRDPTRKVLIGPDMSEADRGKFRVTYFDAQGPSGHTVHNTMHDAARSVVGSYSPEAAKGNIAGKKIDDQWTEFTPESGTLGIPRKEMPQVRVIFRPKMLDYLQEEGVNRKEETVPAASLKPTQREFSPEKVKTAEGGDRPIIISSDNYVVDGHHGWMAKREAGEDIKVIRLDHSISEVLPIVREFAGSIEQGRPKLETKAVKEDVAITPTGREVPVTYALVEADSLVASQRDEGGTNPNYPGELQPRDRSRGASDAQIAQIAQNLDPRLLDKNPSAGDGAPIIADDGVVESGNGRVLAIRRAYNEGLPTAEKYKAYLAEQGYPVEGMQRPVLVRVRKGELSPLERKAFTREANERTTLAMSAPERAMADAAAISDDLVAKYRGGEVEDAGNREFVKGFIKAAVGQNEQAAMVSQQGAMSQEAIRRVQGALLAKAYGDPDLVSTLLESPDNNIKAIGGALMDVAGQWAQMRTQAKAEDINPDVDVTPRLMEAVRLVQRARNEGRPLVEYVNQTDIFSGKTIHPEAELLLRLMFKNDRSWTSPTGREKLADALRFYVTEALKTQPGVNMFGEPAPGPAEILTEAKRRQGGGEEAAKVQGKLTPSDRTPSPDTGAPSGGREQAGRRPEAERGAGVPRKDEGTPSTELTLPGGQKVTIENPNEETFIAVVDGKRVGQMNLTLKRSAPYATSIEVTGQRRLGVATALYDAAEKVLGRRLIPSPLGLSDSAVAFWKNRLGKMEPEEKQALLAESLKVGQDAKVGKSARQRVDQLGYREPPELSPQEAMRAQIRAEGEKRKAAAQQESSKLKTKVAAVREKAKAVAKAVAKEALGKKNPKPRFKMGELIKPAGVEADEWAALKAKLESPKIAEAIAKMDAIEPTLQPGEIPPDEWFNSRLYTHKGEHYRGFEVIDPLIEDARTLATDEINAYRKKNGLPAVPGYTTAKDRKAIIIIGPPAAGKSTIANAIAYRMKAAIADVDEAKKVIPEYYDEDGKGGIGANAVHDESSLLGQEVMERLKGAGDNFVIPKIGHKASSIENLRKELKNFGYDVELVLMDVDPQTALGRMLGRFDQTGRLIAPDYFLGTLGGPQATYDALKKAGNFNGYASVASDNVLTRVSEARGRETSVAHGERIEQDGTIRPDGRSEGRGGAAGVGDVEGQARQETRQIKGGQVQFKLSEEFAPKAAVFFKDLRAILDKMGLSSVKLDVWETIVADIGNGKFNADGQYLRGAIDVALKTGDPTLTIYHEAIHALKALGVFSPMEWSILSRKSKKEWVDRYEIKKNYADFSEEVQVEEGIAHAMSAWANGERMDGVVAKSFKKAKTFLKGVYQALTKHDIRNADDILRQVASGKIGKRAGKPDGSTQPRFIFGGSRSETLDRGGLMRAQDMKDAGASRDEIYDETGFFVGHDGRWRFEINDDDAVLDMSGARTNELDPDVKTKQGTLGSILKHPKLFAAYPNLASIPTTVMTRRKTYSGDYNPDPDSEFIEVIGRNEEEIRSILLHEVMHAVQTREGFAQGGNEMMGEDWTGLEGESKAAEAAVKPLEEEWEAKAAKGDYDSKLAGKINETRGAVVRKARHQYYRRIAGEVEARNVQTRDEMRKKLKETGDQYYQPDAPWWTQDVPADKVVFTYSKNGTAFKATETVDMFEGKREQFVIPGAEKITDRQLAERQMQGKMQPKKGQKSIGDLPLFSDQKDQLALFQIGYHGTGAIFDKFDMSRLASGTGRKDLGWGMYFSNLKTVARGYREKLAGGGTDTAVLVIDQYTNPFQPREHPGEQAIAEELKSAGVRAKPGLAKFVSDTITTLQEKKAYGVMGSGMTREIYSGVGKFDPERPGMLVTAELPDKENMIDTGKTIARQHPDVRAALKKAGYDMDMSGKDLMPHNREEAMQLVEMGILGHKFHVNEKEKVFVIYDDRSIEMLPPKQARQVPGGQMEVDPQLPRFKLNGAPATQMQATQVMQGFIARGQPVDRALRVPFQLLGGLDSNAIWNPGKRLTDKMGPQGLQGAGMGAIIGGGLGSFGGPIGTAVGASVGATAGAYIANVSPSPTGKFRWMSSIAENGKRGLIDGYGLDPHYVEAYRRSDQGKAAILREAQGIMKVLSSAGVGTQEAQVLQQILTGEPINDAAMTRLAVPIRQAIDDLGAEAVSLGLISAESFQRNRGAYLHRVYAKNEIDQNTLAGWVSARMTNRRKKIIGDQLKGRGMFWDVPMDRLMRDVESFKSGARGAATLGEKFRVIDEVSLTPNLTPGGAPSEKTMRRVYLPAADPVPAKYQGATWVDRGTWEVRKAGKTNTLWRDYTKPERAKMGELVDARYTIAKTFMLMANDLSTGRFFKEVSEKAEWTRSTPPASPWKEGSEYSRFWNDPEIQWVKVPDTNISDTGGKKRWGALAGKWVRAEIWRDLNEVQVANNPGVWRTLLSQWKKNKTARNPVVHMNNVMSNLMLMDLADVRAQDLAAGIKAYRQRFRRLSGGAG